ncbi:MAG: VOC family protein [Acidobacteria bacterium]|nr:VOC family protein [Acidobacteriota bacterium]
MSTNHHIDYVEFPARTVEELGRTRAFFEAAFGWSYQQWGDDYADTRSSGVGSGINAEDPSASVLPVIYVEDLEAAFERVKASGGSITKEIFSFPGGRRFHFTDPAGNELGAWSDSTK